MNDKGGVASLLDLGGYAEDTVSPLQLFQVLSMFNYITIPCSPEDSILGLETLLGDRGWLSVGKSDQRGGVRTHC